jgi:hypothetical protein
MQRKRDTGSTIKIPWVLSRAVFPDPFLRTLSLHRRQLLYLPLSEETPANIWRVQCSARTTFTIPDHSIEQRTLAAKG